MRNLSTNSRERILQAPELRPYGLCSRSKKAYMSRKELVELHDLLRKSISTPHTSQVNTRKRKAVAPRTKRDDEVQGRIIIGDYLKAAPKPLFVNNDKKNARSVNSSNITLNYLKDSLDVKCKTKALKYRFLKPKRRSVTSSFKARRINSQPNEATEVRDISCEVTERIFDLA